MDSGQIGAYSITGEIGRGGMGVVYLARDTRLDRDVAIKALPEHLAQDPDRLARFEREAKVVAQLSHPNIAGVYALEEYEGKKYLVMEYVEGETLAERLDRGALPVDEALEFATQIAAGVEAAHEAGVIHRDLKPGNVIVTRDGKAKVLDFGLARVDESPSSTSASGADGPTLTSPAKHSPTMPGVILGTAAYMSPEQARGRKVDRRTDIWSFGVVLYEMLTGANPLIGESVSDSIGAVLHKEIDLDRLPPHTPPIARLLLRRCLERDTAQRYRDMGDVGIELAEARRGGASDLVPGAQSPEAGRTAARPWIVGTVVALAIIAGVGGFLTGRRAAPMPTLNQDRFEIPLQDTATFNVGRPAISPNGEIVAYIDQDQIWVRRLDSFDARAVEGSEHGAAPFWSPDSKWLGFGRGNELVKVPATGGRPTVITRAASAFSAVGAAAWSEDDRIYFSTGDEGISEVSANGGEPRVYVPVQPPDDDDFHELTLLPDGKTVVFTVHSRTRPWYLAISDGTQRRELVAYDTQATMTPAYSPTGHILFHRSGEDQSVWAVPISPAKLAVTGPAFLVSMDDGSPSVSRTGTLALTRRIIGFWGAELVEFPLGGGDVRTLTHPGGQCYDPAMSPDGSTVAVAGFSAGAVDIWLLDLLHGTRTRLTYDQKANEVLPRWSPDGRVIAYARTMGSTFERAWSGDSIHFLAADGSGETRPPIEGGSPTFDDEWRSIVFTRVNQTTGRDIYAQSLDGTSEPRPIVNSPATEEQPALSPDRTFLAYVSNESGMQQVYVTRFPSGEGKWQASSEMGFFPVWSPDGKRLYFCGPEVNVLEVDFNRDDRIMISPPRVAVDGLALSINPYSGYSFSSDGTSLVMLHPTGKSTPPAIGVIRNWYEEFRDR